MAKVIWSLQGVAKDWYYGIQIGALCIFPSAPFFHVSCLKKLIGDKFQVQTIFLELDEEGKIILEPEVVTEIRTRQLRN